LNQTKQTGRALTRFRFDSSQVSAEYDRNSNKDFLSEVSLSGSSGKVDYELTNKFGGATDYKLSTKTSDGTTLEAEGSVDADISSGIKDVSVSKVSASRSVSLSGISMNGVSPQDCDLELSHDLSSSESKLKLSTVLGSGVKVRAIDRPPVPVAARAASSPCAKQIVPL
jgi:hypothetical protein